MSNSSVLSDLWIETRYGRIFGRTAGQEVDPLILGLHGWSQRNGWHTWESLMSPLANAGFRVLSVDMPGWGRSESLKNVPLSTGEAVSIVSAILDALGAPSAVLMGKSWGGGIAISTALEQPARVIKLILTAPAFRQIDRLGELSQPVLLAWAEDDPVIPFAYAKEFRRDLRNVSFVSYATGGHSAAPKNAEDFAPKAIDFLRK